MFDLLLRKTDILNKIRESYSKKDIENDDKRGKKADSIIQKVLKIYPGM
tara:strand:+ start:114 stop:260 length:147 start_codon:yes stop_codon:yes gene_type:complete